MSEETAAVTFDQLDLDKLDTESIAINLVTHALDLPASDVFVVADERDTEISVRHLGMLRSYLRCSRETGRRIINHLKAMANMDVSQSRRPQDGRTVYRQNGDKVDLRISTIPTLYGEDMALRLLRRGMSTLKMPELGLNRKELNDVYNLLNQPSGLVLAVGPTGSGKTTTLYACLQYLNNGARKINTIEDPIEYELPGVRQSQVNVNIRVDFPDLLRGVLRQGPDVVMIGEIRDPVTAETAVRAANSGHLVLATLHAAVAPAAIDAMLAYNAHPHFLATCLLGIISQRLLRTLCERCKTEFDLTGSPQTFEDVQQWLEPGEGEKLYSAPGCDRCYGTGYADRTGVFEVLGVSNEVRQLILDEAPVIELRQKAVEQGMLDLRRSALLKVAKGVTSTEEVVRMISTEHLVPE